MSVSVTRAYFVIIMKYEIEWYREVFSSLYKEKERALFFHKKRPGKETQNTMNKNYDPKEIESK